MEVGNMNIDDYIQRLEESRARGNKVASLEDVLTLLRSIRKEKDEKIPPVHFHTKNEQLHDQPIWEPYTGLQKAVKL